MRAPLGVTIALWVIGAISLTTTGTVIGIAGGVAGCWAVWKVSRLATDLEDALGAQAHEIRQVRSQIEARMRGD